MPAPGLIRDAPCFPGCCYDDTGAADAKFLQIAGVWAAMGRQAGRRPGCGILGAAMQRRRQAAGLFTGLSLAGFSLAGLSLAALGLALGLLLGACAHNAGDAAAANPELNAPPADYKHEILGAMHAYLNDPTGIRDAAIAEPALRTINNSTRYIVCLRYSAKKRGGYASEKEVAAVFMVGRFDRFVEKPQEACAGANYTPFPELQKLSR
jgi:hypothetical protein